jgi:3-hydroxybutyryl-CoA dehydrogenase
MHNIAVIGAGRAGLDFALRCVQAGFNVILEDVMPSRLRDVGTPPSTRSGRVGSGTLHLASTVEDAVRNADLALDFVPDELESKFEIFSLLDRMAPPRTILCTPTSALSIADLASCTYRPQLCFALELAPAQSPSAARLIHTTHSAPEALAAVEHWLRTLRLSVTVEKDTTESMLTSTPGTSHSNKTVGD